MCIWTPLGVICIDHPTLIAIASIILGGWGWVVYHVRKRWKK